ncbi:RecF/RecN/SMC N terminal domain-containing protein [Xylaria palmicola]|nr:RecF/RecN/SMC N terminal domain-containing protein [Xylaria palmicola]
MRVIEVIIDGFKSYAVRTVISGWDESFNSITGLNGSGKSNILDSICFVLGITNMSTVRAQNLQDLIYKRGQAGVTKASVTIVFDNKDKQKSPIGFEEYATISVTRQIVLGGTSKYLINGHRAQQQTVQNLFQSVQLNINNPNFLIMQGKITKVLNMKSVEILAMIEEAAGTRMFEDRRDKALKTMAKKEMKLQEITELLRDEIEPKLEKLRTEKRAFLDFQQTQNDLERLTRVVVAHDYVKYQERLEQSETDLDKKRQRQKDLEESAARLKSEISHLEQDVKRVRAERDKELKKGGKAQALEDKVKKYSNELVRLATVMDLKESSKGEEEERKVSVQKNVAELEAALQEKTKAYEKIKAKYDAAKEENEKQAQEAESKEELLQTLQTGVASKEGQESGYQGQLQDARNRAATAATEQEQAKIKIAHLEKRIKEEEPRARKAKEQNAGLLNELEGLRSQSQKLEAQLGKLGFEPGQEEEMFKKQSSLQQSIRGLRQEADTLKRKVANIDFNYADPTPNFDRSKVKGLVAQLFTLDKDHTEAGTALEICAGGRLYNVVVDSEVTGTQLLQGGKLRKRVTIIPLNKIAAFKASAQTIATAAEAKKRQTEANADIKRIEKDMKDFENNKDSKLVELQASLDKLRNTLTKNSTTVKTLQKELQNAQLDSEQVSSDLAAAREQLLEVEMAIKAQQEEIEDLIKKQTELQETHDVAQAALDDERAKLTGFDDELRALEDATRSKNARIAEESLEMQKLGHQVDKFNKEQQNAVQAVAHMEQEHEWIADEKDKFGRAGTPYDFKSQNITECKATLKNLTERFQGMKKKINPKVDAALDLSHTQNIGRLIKTRFKGSQFIVVSLKDGMFQNANRIFRTRFSEGTSVVQALTAADFR